MLGIEVGTRGAIPVDSYNREKQFFIALCPRVLSFRKWDVLLGKQPLQGLGETVSDIIPSLHSPRPGPHPTVWKSPGLKSGRFPGIHKDDPAKTPSNSGA